MNINEIRNKLDQQTGRAYWQSLEELADTDAFQEFLHKEFPRQAAPLESSLNRRDFMKLLGASLALAGLSACARPPIPQEKVVPYVRAPEEIIPGVPLYYASAVTSGGYAQGVLVESHMGRPTKVEGNPEHPASLGASDPQALASVLGLYDPDRSQFPLFEGALADVADFRESVGEVLAGLESGRGLHILTETVTSPTLTSQLSEVLARYPNAQWHQYDPTFSDNLQDATERAFGQYAQPVYDFSEADVILSLGADFLGDGAAKLRYTKDFSRRRKVLGPEDEMNRLYLVEPTPSLTGSMADHRLALDTSAIETLARGLAQELGAEGGSAYNGEVSADWLDALVQDLQAHRGSSVVVAGPEQPVATQMLAFTLNEALGNVGTTVRYLEPVVGNPVKQLESLNSLVDAMNAGEVELLVILGGNPVYTAPADLAFAEALQGVPVSVHLSLYADETSALSSWHLPLSHELEAWSDARAFDGTATIMQPLLAPFYGGMSPHELLGSLLGEETTSFEAVQAYWRNQVEGDFDVFWRQSVYSGVVEGSAASPLNPRFQGQVPEAADADAEGLEVIFRADPSIGDGRFANNAWLQELPKPFTKLTWDNAALVSPATAEALNLNNGDGITLSAEGRSVEAGVWIVPGQAANTVTLHLGYGRERAGKVGTGTGYNAYAVRSSGNPWLSRELEVQRSGRGFDLVSTQTHQTMEGRHLVRHGTLEEFRAEPDHPEFVNPVAHIDSDLYPDFEYNSYAWGMVIDLNVCTGCNACVTACQSENNIPVVGKEQVSVGREMHWIRVDAYYSGDLDNPEIYHQPVPCMHCEKAPCEPVCPVGATVHDHEGLNVMVYNRCVGTRYCSNNCPYKVRRFNFLQYAEFDSPELAMLKNPDVTVRSRGVMEKCTYCTQRISSARIVAERENRQIRDGEVVTACQSACPAEAIVFGDINDAESAVSTYKASHLNYALLEEVNTFPRTTYLAKLNNPSPVLAAAVPAESGEH